MSDSGETKFMGSPVGQPRIAPGSGEHAGLSGSRESEDADAIELMARYGITHIPADRFFYKNHRYSQLADAVAQANRDSRAAEESRTCSTAQKGLILSVRALRAATASRIAKG